MVRAVLPLPRKMRIVLASKSRSFGMMPSASLIRSPALYKTTINARFRMPVDARFEHARISDLTCSGVSGSAGSFWPLLAGVTVANPRGELSVAIAW
jgi:hypothetical protein